MTGPSPETRAASMRLRAARAATLQELTSGDVTLSALLTEDTHSARRTTIAGATVQRVLQAVVGVGPDTARRICLAARVERAMKFGDVSAVGRRRIVDAAAKAVDLTGYTGRGPRKAAS